VDSFFLIIFNNGINMKFSFGIFILLFSACSSFQPVKELTQVNLRGPNFELGNVNAQFDTLIPGRMENNNIVVSYYPEDDVICLRFRHNFITYYQFWSANNRQEFIDALAEYKQAFEERNLPNRNRRTKRQYGTVRGLVIWESSRFGEQGTSHPNIDIGYQFKNRSPYFSITQNQAPNITEITRESSPKNPALTMYFTRSQADALAELFDTDLFQNLSNVSDISGNVDIDEF